MVDRSDDIRYILNRPRYVSNIDTTNLLIENKRDWTVVQHKIYSGAQFKAEGFFASLTGVYYFEKVKVMNRYELRMQINFFSYFYNSRLNFCSHNKKA